MADARIMDFVSVLSGLGFSLIPLKSQDKAPWLYTWKKWQTEIASDGQLAAWFDGASNRNVGVVTGAVSKIVVVDADSEMSVAWAEGSLPATPWKVQTARGWHYYYRHPQSNQPNLGEALGGLHFRGDGGYVVGPGSVHPDGPVYTPQNWPWKPDDIVPVFDRAAIVDESRKSSGGGGKSYVQTAVEYECRAVSSATEGARNTVLNKAAFALGQLVGGGAIGREEVERSLTIAAQMSGLGDKEIESTIKSGIEAGVKQPRRAPEHGAKKTDLVGSAIEIHESKSEEERRIAFDVLCDICRETFSWREGAKNYSTIHGRLMTASEWQAGYTPDLLRRILEDCTETLEAAEKGGKTRKREDAAISVWRKWAKPAFLQVSCDVPTREGQMTFEEEKGFAYVVVRAINTDIRVSQSHEEIPIHTSIYQEYQSSQASGWRQVGHYPAYVREDGIAFRFELLYHLKLVTQVTKKSADSIMNCEGIADSKVIKVGAKPCRAYVLRREWLDRQFGDAQPERNLDISSDGEIPCADD